MDKTEFDITIDARMINHSGIGTYLKNMIPILHSNYNLVVLGRKKIFERFLWVNKLEIIEADYPIYSLSEQVYLPKFIPKTKIFLSPHYNVPIKKVDAEKRVVIIHDVNHLVFNSQLSLIKKLYARFMMNSAVDKSDRIITISQFSRKEILNYIDTKGKNIDIIYPGIGPQTTLQRNEFIIKDVLLKYNLPQKYFLYVGSLKHHKNLTIALKAFEELLPFYPKEKLVLLGINQEEFNKTHEYERYKDWIIIPGYIEDEELATIYKNARCLVFPSYYEGFGLPPLEAMSYGCPVISSNAASLPEVCGNAALLFDPFDKVELTKKMRLIIENKKLSVELINKGYNNIVRFSRNNFAERLKQVFDSIIFS